MLKKTNKIRFQLQQVGSYLSGMIMPNIGAFIAWGLITALFIPAGWFPKAKIAALIEPIMVYLLPILIGYTGGKLVFGTRGAVVATLATTGLIVGAEMPMLMGAMLMGPVAAWLLKSFDKLITGKVPTGFEMLVNNFSTGVMGMLLAITSLFAVGPAMEYLNGLMVNGINYLVHHQLLSLISLLVEPGKVLFLNNAINHVALGPLGIEQATETGKSILFLIEANPGPGLGILLAYTFFGVGSMKQTAPGAAIIQLFGGIHEIYFPYILMKPALILSAISGGIIGILTFSLFNVGLVGPVSPGSILAILTLTPRGDYLGIIAGILTAATVSFSISVLIIKFSKVSLEIDLSTKKQMGELKRVSKPSKSETETTNEAKKLKQTSEFPEIVNKIIFAYDVEIGTSAMGASILRKKMQEAGMEIEIKHALIDRISKDSGTIMITQQELTLQALKKFPESYHISVVSFMKNKEYDALIKKLS